MPSLADFTARAQPKRIRPPGELVAYNNYDFVLTGRLIEIASGQPFADYVAEHVFDPAGMSATAIQGNHDQGSDVATTYRPDGDTQVETAGLHSPATPTGGDMITTGGDLARFMIAQLDQDAALGQDVARQMQSQQFTAEPRIPGMGYAFEQRPRNGQPIVAKDGDLPGIHHNLALIPEAGLGIHVAYNGDGVGGVAFWDAKDLTYKIIDEALPDSEGTSNNQVSTDVSGYAGNYGDSRTSRTTFTAVTGLTNPITVEAAGPGRLITSGMSEDPSVAEQHWHQVEPGLFRSDDADATLAFGAGGTMVTSQAPAAGFQKLSWQQSPMLHLAIVGVAAVLLAVAFVLIPIRALVRRSRTGSAHTAQGRVALILGWLAAACVVIFGGAFAYLASDPNRMMQVPLTGTLLLSIALNTVSVLGVITAAVVVLAVLAWVRRWWKLPGRIAYSVLALAAIAFRAVAVTYRLVGVPLTVTV